MSNDVRPVRNCRAICPVQNVTFSVRQLFEAIAEIGCVLAGFVTYGIFGASFVTAIIGVLLIRSDRHQRRVWHARTGCAVLLPAVLVMVISLFSWMVLGVGPIYSSTAWPYELKRMAELADPDSRSIRVVGLGSFIDTEHAWLIHVEPEALEAIEEEYGLAAIAPDQVPPSFWSKFPRWWRPRPRQTSLYLATPSFPARSRGPDGDHLLTMYDSERQCLYVWHKLNF